MIVLVTISRIIPEFWNLMTFSYLVLLKLIEII